MQPQPVSRAPRVKRRVSCLSSSVWIGAIVLFVIASYAQTVRSAVSDYLANQLGKSFGLVQSLDGNPLLSAGEEPGYLHLPAGEEPGRVRLPTGEELGDIQQHAKVMLPTLIDALPRGRFRISDGEVNTYLAARPEAIAPVEQATLTFLSGRAEALVRVFGMDHQVSLELEAQDGMLVVRNPRLKGPMNVLVPFEELARTLEHYINQQLQARGRAVQQLQCVPGAIVVALE